MIEFWEFFIQVVYNSFVRYVIWKYFYQFIVYLFICIIASFREPKLKMYQLGYFKLYVPSFVRVKF